MCRYYGHNSYKRSGKSDILNQVSIPSSAKTLQISYVGMQTQEVVIKPTVKVILKPDSKMLDELVVVGYGVTSKKDLTGAVATVSAEKIKNEPVLSVGQALQGKTAGLQVVSTGGRAGDGTQISLRGNGSLRASNDVLYVIDGVPQDNMNNVAPQDIRSISVLKDAASTAIYGSRASNGVVLIETKKGNYSQPTTVNVNSYYGIQNIIKKPKLLNAAEYKKVMDASRINYEKDIAAGLLDGPKDPTTLTPLPESRHDIDWLKLVLRDNASIQNHQISVTSGGETTKAYLSGNLFMQDGIVKQDSYTAARLRANLEQKINKYVTVGLNANFTYSKSKPFADDNNIYQPYSKALQARPDVPPTDENGKIIDYNFVNPLFGFQRQVTNIWQNTGGNLYLNVTPFEGLVWRSAYSGTIRNRRYNRYDAPNTRRGLNGDGQPTGYGYYGTDNDRDYQIENTITYSDSFFNERLKLNFLLGHSFQNWDYEDSYVAGEKFPSDDLRWLVSAGEINKGRSYIKSMAIESYFTRLQLNWDEKYHLMMSIRRDASSKFTKENNAGYFPAISAGWTISNEDFFNKKVVTDLKLRASFGYTGNQSGVSYASGQNLIVGGENYNLQPGLAATDIFNPDLTWEKGRSVNIGFDMKLLDRVSIGFDYYDKRTESLLNRINVPQESGFRTMMANVGNISNKGFELTVDANIFDRKELKWTVGANFSYNKNKVISIGTEAGQYTTGFVSIVKEGESLGSFTLYEAQGVAKEKYVYKDKDGKDGKVVLPGDMIYVDQNQDGKIDDADKKVFGGGIAPVYGGFNTRLDYKGFDFALSGQYSIGKRVYAFYKKDALNGGATGAPSYSYNMYKEMLGYWTPENTSTNIPRPHMSAAISAWNMEHSSRFLEKADYLRISEITLGYDLKSIKALKLGFIKSLRVYVQGRNLFTFTPYSTGDPETSYVDQTAENSQDVSDGMKVQAGVDLGGLPNTKSVVFGLNLTF
ncbi:SusC/RagA family TonB-linked outer membrane protein [Bacteroides pyogenes]|uniref:SusC/RagA family TonB-linked outer membrane protein n=1 Tax=Bacteroides pyogenes TaxID=310300 RepID=UPI003B43474B